MAKRLIINNWNIANLISLALNDTNIPDIILGDIITQNIIVKYDQITLGDSPTTRIFLNPFICASKGWIGEINLKGANATTTGIASQPNGPEWNNLLTVFSDVFGSDISYITLDLLILCSTIVVFCVSD